MPLSPNHTTRTTTTTTTNSSRDQTAPKPYRNSVCPSSLYTTSTQPSHPATEEYSCTSQNETSTPSIPAPSEQLEDEQHEQDSTSSDDDISTTNTDTSSSRSSSVRSSKSSLREEAAKQQDGVGSSDSSSNNHINHKMLSFDNMSTTSSSSSSSLPASSSDAPLLPPRSARRASRMLGSIPQKKAVDDDQPMLPHAAPHQIYLSSEEDASSSADDFSDFGDVESDAEGSRKPAGRFIREDTARVVSVVFYGKPSIITLSRRSISPSSSDVSDRAGILRTATEPALKRPSSVSSTSSSSLYQHPPRSSSMVTTTLLEKRRPGFLHIDPYAKGSDDSLRTPRTPTTMLRKTLNLVKKRSRPNLHQSESQLTRMEQVGEVDGEDDDDDDPRESLCLEPATPSSAVSYEDIIKSARRSVSSPKSPKSRFRSGLSLGRQRSIKA